MKLLLLNHNVVERSTFYRAFYFGREFADLGHEVTLASISRRNVLRPVVGMREGVRFVETPDLGMSLIRTGWDPWDTAWRILRFLGERFDVVHGFDCRPVVLGPCLTLKALGRTAWISDWADWWGRGGAISLRKSWVGRVAFAPFETFLEERFRHLADQVTVTSRALEGRALALGIARERVHHIPSGANVRTIPVLDAEDCRRQLALPHDAPIACFVGFVQYDLALAVRAFAVARRTVPHARLLLVGPPNRQAERWISDLGLDRAVHATGPLPFARVPVAMGAADVLLLPYSNTLANRARGPIKLGDYLAAGRAVLANPVGDLVEVFQADEIGVLAPDDVEGYGTALADLLQDRQRTARMGRTARKVAEDKYAWKHVCGKLLEVYGQVT
ncbi:MAG: glycosyltransferase family 4 protein [Deltaproteobacteria bacterium]|nr:glycosyltransferase family 4 protein [Deltaproteobacteria bacterium]